MKLIKIVFKILLLLALVYLYLIQLILNNWYSNEDTIIIMVDDEEENNKYGVVIQKPLDNQKAQVELLLHNKAKELMEMPLRYYIYDLQSIDNIMDSGILDQNTTVYRERHLIDIKNDEQIMEALKKSPHRTYDVDRADFFLPPIPFGRIWTNKNDDRIFHSVFDVLFNHSIFQQYKGNHHFFIVTTFALFKGSTRPYTNLQHYYDKVYNVTIVQSFDPCAVYNRLHQDDGDTWAGDYKEAFEREIPVTKRSVSIGLGSPNHDLNLILASSEKFHQSSNLIFYHSRKKSSYWNSTIYRHAPITNRIIGGTFLPKSSIGFDIRRDVWERNLMDSKFCPVIRGDSPHSHALWRSIRVGCIPVIIADTMPVFAPLFKNTLNLEDFAVIIKEEDLIKDTWNTLLQLNSISKDDIEIKILHLAFAQCVLFTDHPNSLFVPALLKELTMASEVERR